MAKNYSKENSCKSIQKEIDSLNYGLNPSENSIQFILNFSKSLRTKTSKKVGTFFLNLN